MYCVTNKWLFPAKSSSRSINVLGQHKVLLSLRKMFSFSNLINTEKLIGESVCVKHMHEHMCVIPAFCGPPSGHQRNKSTHILLVRSQAFLIDIFCIFLPTVTHWAASPNPYLTSERTWHLECVTLSLTSLCSLTYQTLNHVLGCRPSPPILLILPKPHSFCLLLRLRLKGA